MSNASNADDATSPGKLTNAVLRGSAVTLIEQAAGTLIRFGSNLVITRLLAPEHFGVMAIVTVFLTGIHLFSDIGVGPNIIQGKRGDDPIFLDTAWTVQALRGAILTVIAAAAGWPLARIYGVPELAYLLPAAGLTAVIGGLESTKVFTTARSLSFVIRSVLDLLTQVAGVAAIIGFAWWYRSVWALIVGQWVSTVLRVVLTHAMLPGHNNRFRWDRDARRSIIEFGRWVVVSTMFTFLAGQSDRLILGKLITTAELGVYSIGANIAALPLQIIQQVSHRVFFPVVSAAMRSAEHDVTTIRRSRVRLLTTLAPVLALAIALAEPAIAFLYDERYLGAGLIATYLAIGTWVGAISNSYSVVLLAAGRPKALSFANAAKLFAFTIPLWFAATHYGAEGAALVVGLSELAFLVVAQAIARKGGMATIAADYAITVGVAVLSGLYVGLHHLVLEATGVRLVALAVPTLLGLALAAVLAKKLRLLAPAEPAKTAA